MPAPFTYPYDPIGTDPSCLIVAELHNVTPPVDLERANFIVPLAAPFYSIGLHVRTGSLPNSPALVEGTDYILTHRFVEASNFTGRQIYGSIMFINRQYTGNVWLTYQTLGGAYTLNDVGIVESVTRSLYNIRLVSWTQINGLVAAFPPIPHPHDTADLTGMSNVVIVLQNMIAAISASGGTIGGLASTIMNHLTSATAHTKAAIGLGSLENYPLATQEDVELLRTNRYMNPLMVRYAINRFNLVGNAVIDATNVLKGIVRLATPLEAADVNNNSVAITPATMSIAQRIRVNCIYMTVDPAENPASSLGYGTWIRIAKDRYLKGYNPDTLPTPVAPLAEGGSLAVNIAIANLPAEGIDLTLPVRVGGGGDPGDPGALDRNDYTNGEVTVQTGPLGAGEALNIDPAHVVVCFWLRTA